MCNGTGCSPQRSQRFRDKMAERRDGLRPLPVVVQGPSAPKRVPPELRGPCAHQGAEVPGCKTCGGPGSVLYYCESPDDDADRCVRGRSRDPSVRSCLTCDHYEERK